MELGSGGVGRALTDVIETLCVGENQHYGAHEGGHNEKEKKEGVHRINDYDLLNHPLRMNT